MAKDTQDITNVVGDSVHKGEIDNFTGLAMKIFQDDQKMKNLILRNL